MARADLILKLNVRKDERTVAPVETGGHIRYFFSTFTGNFRTVLLVNVIYALIFALPLLFSAFVLPTLATNYVMNGKSFVGNFGIGFPNVTDNLNEALHTMMLARYAVVYPCIIFSIFVAFVGLSGVFHVSRGLLWGEKVIIKSFFRGIKHLWKPFMITGAGVAALSAGLLYGIGWCLEQNLLGQATAGSWILFVALILVGLLAVMYLFFLLPTFSCYRFSFKESLQNAGLFVCLLPLPTLIVSIIAIGLMMLTAINAMMGYIFVALLFTVGFMFYAMMITTFGQYAFDGFIVPQVDPKNPLGRRPVTVQTAVKGKDVTPKGQGQVKGQPAKGGYTDKQQPKKPVNYGQYKPTNYKKKKRK